MMLRNLKFYSLLSRIGMGIALVVLLGPTLGFSQSTPSDSSYIGVTDASANLGFGFDDNVFRTASPDSDYYYKSEAELGFGADSGEVPWSFSAKTEDKRFFEFHRESTFDSFLNAKANYSPHKHWKLDFRTGYEHDHIDREDPSTHQAETQARITRLTGGTTITHQFGSWANAVSYDVKDLNFRGVSSDGEDINTDDEDRVEQEVQISSKYELSDIFSPKFELTLSNGSYDSGVDDGGFGRDLKALQAMLGAEFEALDSLSGEVMTGPVVHDFKEQQFDDFTSMNWVAQLQWHEKDSKHTTTFVTERDFRVTNVADASGYFQMVYQLSHEYKVTKTLTAAAQATYVDINFRGLDLDLDDLELMPSLEYQMLDSLVGRFEYSWKERSSNSSDSEFEAHRVFGSLKYSFL